jgi:hypothetical protein
VSRDDHHLRVVRNEDDGVEIPKDDDQRGAGGQYIDGEVRIGVLFPFCKVDRAFRDEVLRVVRNEGDCVGLPRDGAQRVEGESGRVQQWELAVGPFQQRKC